jgi:crotonobetainyl-CoA:carnitine CoA-transferase CaiB-like acyl-CoA transferase
MPSDAAKTADLDEVDAEPPLAGLTVLDCSTYIAGPATATALGDWGADVIKVEAPGIGDPHRNSYKGANYPPGAANFPWQLDGRNKRSVALDLKHPDGRNALDRLIARADVMVVNFPPKVRGRLRLAWKDVKPVNPRLIYASLSGYGETGPDADTPGFDATAFFARSGILDAARYEGQPPAFSLSTQGDRPSAMTLLAAIMLGLYRRERTGRGGWVGTSLYANGVWSNGTLAAGALVGASMGPRPPRERPRSIFGNQYVCRDGRWFTLLLPQEEKRWPAFCAALGLDALAVDPRFADSALRRANAAMLVVELDRVFATQDWAHWREVLVAVGAAVSPISRAMEIPQDPQARHAGIIVETETPEVPLTLANPVRLGFAKTRAAGRAPALGEHSEAVLSEMGFTPAEIAALRQAGVLGE